MTANARLLVEVAASLGTFREDMGKAAAIADANAKKIQGAFSETQKSVLAFGKSIAGALGVGFGVDAILGAFRSIHDAAADEQRALNQLQATLEATGHAAGLTAEQLEKIGAGVRGRTVFDDDELRKAETALLRFREIAGDTFKQAIELAPDVATALGTDLVTAAQALGRALTDPEHGMKALKAAGLALSDQNKDLAARLVEAGNKAGAQKIVLDELTKSIGGLSESDNQGAYGASKRLTRAWDDLLKSFGRPLVADTGKIDALTAALERFVRVRERAADQKDPLDIFKRIAEVAGLRDETFPVPQPLSQKDEAAKIADEKKTTEGALAAAKLDAQNIEYEELKRHLKQMGEASAAFNAAELQMNRSAVALEQDALDSGYARGEISIEEYYAKQRSLSAANLAAIEKDLNKQLEAQAAIAHTDQPGHPGIPLFDANERAAARKAEEEIANRLNAARQALSLNDQQRLEKERLDVEKLADEYGNLAEQIALATGNDAAAAAIGVERQQRQFRRQLTAKGDTAGLADQDKVAQQAVLVGSLTTATRKYTDTVEALGIAQAKIDIQEQTGTQSEIDLLSKKAEVAKQYIPILLAQIDAQQKIADSLEAGTVAKDEALAKIAQEKLLIEQLGATADGLKNKFNNIFSDNFTTALDAIVNRTKSVKDAFKDMGRSIAQEITHLANQQIAKQLYKALFGGGDSGSGLDIGGILAKLFGGAGSSGGGGFDWGSLFGSSAGAGAGTAAGGSFGGYFAGDAFAGLAGGTDSWRGGPVWVGERGPELVNLPQGSQVTPAHQSRGRPSMHHTNVFHINVLPGASRASADQAAMATGRAVSQAIRRNG